MHRPDVECLPKSIQTIITEIRSHRDQMTPSLLRKIVVAAEVNQEELMPWADYAHPLTDSYGRKLIFEDDFFEIMVMSWTPGDTSAIHDHGHTQWGTVQIFGPAEHATFLVQDETLTTLNRVGIKPGQIITVGHHLIHQMANTSEENFLSLHIYGVSTQLEGQSVTSGARIWDITQGTIQRTDGGVFFALLDQHINATEPAPKSDFLSWLHNTVEYLHRVRRALKECSNSHFQELEISLTKNIFDTDHWDIFERDLMPRINEAGHVIDSRYWQLLRTTLIRAAHLQSELLSKTMDSKDAFSTYAELYDEVIGKQCLDSFTSKYIQFFHDTYKLDFTTTTIYSIGCGTGIMEEHILDTYQVPRENLLGMDVSPAMVEVAARKINAKVQNIVEDFPDDFRWDLCFASLNVFQYLPQEMMEKAIANTAVITKSGGYFVGDFITPDHVRWYPNVISSKSVISLRQPSLLEQNHNTFQQSEIINVNKLQGNFRITYEGKHVRYLPSLWKVRYMFERYFGDNVDIFDAITLEPLARENDTSPSTRYLVVAQRK